MNDLSVNETWRLIIELVDLIFNIKNELIKDLLVILIIDILDKN